MYLSQNPLTSLACIFITLVSQGYTQNCSSYLSKNPRFTWISMVILLDNSEFQISGNKDCFYQRQSQTVAVVTGLSQFILFIDLYRCSFFAVPKDQIVSTSPTKGSHRSTQLRARLNLAFLFLRGWIPTDILFYLYKDAMTLFSCCSCFSTSTSQRVASLFSDKVTQ